MKEQNIYQKIRRLAGSFYLRRKIKTKQRNILLASYDKTRTIGIIYGLDTNETYELVADYVGRLQNDGKKVKAIGLVKRKEDTKRFLPKLSFDFIHLSDLNWFGKPGGTYAEEFIAVEFDLLIDLTENDNYTAEYLLSMSNARLTIGHTGIADILIEWKKNMDLKAYIAQIDHYIKIIKNKTNES